MDLMFISVTIVFIAFIILSYLLNVLKLSTPLVLIYLIFCFSYLIDRDIKKENASKIQIEKKGNEIIAENGNTNEAPIAVKVIEPDNIKKIDVSKPIVSFNPKPIIIDSNLIIQKDKDRSKVQIKNDIANPDIKDKNKGVVENSLKLNEIMICRGVYKRNPIKPGFNFTNNVDSLFCYTKISNNGSKREIKHLWYFQDKLITSVVYNIKTSYNYRSWSRKTILPSQIGQWRVDIVNDKDEILGSRDFKISSINESF